MTSPVILLVLPVKPVRSSASRKRNQDETRRLLVVRQTSPSLSRFLQNLLLMSAEAQKHHGSTRLSSSCRDRPCCWAPLLHPRRPSCDAPLWRSWTTCAGADPYYQQVGRHQRAHHHLQHHQTSPGPEITISRLSVHFDSQQSPDGAPYCKEPTTTQKPHTGEVEESLERPSMLMREGGAGGDKCDRRRRARVNGTV